MQYALFIFDRQVRAFGDAGQRLIRHVKGGIVGVGGTGSIVAQELAWLGVQDFVPIDGKVLDDTNLNRVVAAEHGDIGKPKVELCRRLIRRINAPAEVDPVFDSVLSRIRLVAQRTPSFRSSASSRTGARSLRAQCRIRETSTLRRRRCV